MGVTMIQCCRCHRFFPIKSDCCPFCASQDIKPFYPLRDIKFQEEHRAYHINISELEIDGKRYRIEGPLARGGCSVILKLTENGREPFALKVPIIFDEMYTNRQGNSRTLLRKSEKALWDEIHTFDRLDSPYTLRCVFKGAITVTHQKNHITFPAILMELALTSLEHLIYNQACGENPIPQDERIKIVNQLLESVSYLHNNRLVHRDISPANIFVVQRHKNIRYIVSDYGTSRHGDDITSSRFSSSILANAHYLDPQRLQDPSFAYDPRSDVYSVGVVISEIFAGNFWHAIAGSPRREGEPINFPREIIKPHLSRYLDPPLQKIIKKATAYRARSRYASIDALKKSWASYASSQVLRNQTGTFTRFKKTVEPLLLACLSALLVISLQPTIRFFSSQQTQSNSQPIITDHTNIITRLVVTGNISKLKQLLIRKGYIDTYGPNGLTPLHWAMYLKRFKIARLLMDYGASWSMPSRKNVFDIPAGTTPQQLFLESHPRLQQANKH